MNEGGEVLRIGEGDDEQRRRESQPPPAAMSPDWRRASAQPSNPPTRTPGKRTRRKVPVQVKLDSVPASCVIQPRRLADHARPQIPPNAISRRLLPVTLDDCNRGDSTSIGDIPGPLITRDIH